MYKELEKSSEKQEKGSKKWNEMENELLTCLALRKRSKKIKLFQDKDD